MRSARLALALLSLSVLAAPLAAAQPEYPPPRVVAPAIVRPGVYDGVHPDWRDSVVLRADGTYQRGNGDPGRWYVQGNTLVLAWQNWGPERLVAVGPGVYRAPTNGFTLTLRNAPRWHHRHRHHERPDPRIYIDG